MKRKASLFTMAVIAISVGTAVYLPLSLVLDYYDSRDKVVLERERRLIQYLHFAQALYRAGADEDLTAFLREVRSENDIQYFVVYQRGQMTYAEPKDYPLAVGNSFEERKPFVGKDLIDNIRSERSEMLSKDTMLTLGLDKRYNLMFWQVLTHTDVWKVILQDIVIVIAMAALAFWLHTRDLIKLRKNIAQTGRVPDGLNVNSALSAESEAIVAGLKGYAMSERELRHKHDRLINQVLPALKRELFSGEEPPYTFECTLVRTDINGFSQIFNSTYRDRFAEHINEFFVGLAEIASRYEGLIYEFVGDEAIYYFKDARIDAKNETQSDSISEKKSSNNKTNAAQKRESVARAMDAIRDIHALASEINARTQTEGHRFTVKSALAHGTLRFGRQVDGFSLSGGILIETVRILSTVTAKDENQLYFSDRHLSAIGDDVKFESVGTYSLKGYSEDVRLVRWLSSTAIEEHIANALDQGFDFIQKHKSDAHIRLVIDTASREIARWSIQTQLDLVQALRKVRTYKPSPLIGGALRAWLSTTVDRASVDADQWKLASAIVMLYPLLVTKDSISEGDILAVESLLNVKNRRIVANAVDVLCHYGITPSAQNMSDLFVSENNRIAANAVIHAGSKDLTPEVLKRLEQMIVGRKSDDARRSSGLYALGEIARIIRENDPVYYSTRVDLHRLIKKTESLQVSEDASVALQARRAFEKAQLEKHAA